MKKNLQKASVGGVEFSFKIGEINSNKYLEEIGISQEEMILKNLYYAKDGKTLLQLRSEITDGYFSVRIATAGKVNGKIFFQNWKDWQITKEFLEDQYKKVNHEPEPLSVGYISEKKC